MATVTYPCYIQRKDAKSEWRWTYYAKNGEAIGVSSESYKNRSDCSHGITLMQGSTNHPTFYYD
jgi:uncharacterized protein YegP (UPF0339 family)